MFRRAATKSHHFRRLYSQASQGTTRQIRHRPLVIASTTAVAGSVLWYTTNNIVYNDEGNTPAAKAEITKARQELSTGISDDGTITAVVWGSNKSNIIAPQAPGTERVQVPSAGDWLEGVALRDMALHETHAACVDARGNVYQWGDGFFGSQPTSAAVQEFREPKLTLRGKDIIHLQLTESRVFALSASGKVYVFAAKESNQKLPEVKRITSGSPWWGTGWIWGEEPQTIDYMEISPKARFGWGEKFVSIAAGKDHLLALTSSGRTFSHPVDKKANSHGQLGYRKFDIPAPRIASSIEAPARLEVELTPKAIVDPFAKASPFTREVIPTAPATTSDNLDLVDDRQIGFSDSFFEIPALKGVKVTQIAAGNRSSYVNTEGGRVLGWGANESGQLGLGGNVTLSTITVPTEIVLSRNVPASMRTKCLTIATGGDLACFVAERTGHEALTFVDVLTCGNGQWGGLGNNLFSTAQGNPTRARNISGLREYDDQKQALVPIMPHDISVSPTGHVLLTLETQTQSGIGGAGRDLMVWGSNYDYQLGTGKRTSLAVPTTLDKPDGTRFMLTTKKAPVKDLAGKVWKKNADIEQRAVAGYGNSIVYWRIR
ncbi:regulator of chromosome condensation 1/beta-lactamase-inhibitor protein II [Hygrophoropsis aurantiaca]|uniref:Regulator of chromosome condensation 1/beta-lactamase-inhibitor protein II n=1 Tax=Hygrophoropsis aurantiaca TaxID=72124 RepID=A0ACB8AFE8_9AGAM|nr:regulator of chromosome condensation 1/beta-lactamase-inhibitor protein II [Hygrophoropsis aurantiaca]